MAFKLHRLNHSPQWYHDHCSAEDGGSPAFRAMLTKDMKFIDADIDSTHTYMERVHTYEEYWNKTLSGKKSNADPADLAEVMERELALGFRPKDQYAKEPFRSFTRLMEKHKITTTELKEFIKWKAKDGNLKSARATKADKTKAEIEAKRRKLFGRKPSVTSDY